jgi:hypothetical protein
LLTVNRHTDPDRKRLVTKDLADQKDVTWIVLDKQ